METDCTAAAAADDDDGGGDGVGGVVGVAYGMLIRAIDGHTPSVR